MTSIAERHKYILECLNRNGFIKVNDIAKDLEVTPVTIRKDLKYLEEKKLLYRTHGSASPINPVTPEINVQEKEKLEKNDSIIIASGSTVHMLAEQLTPIEHLIVVTASLKTAILLNAVNNIEVIQLGGTVRKNSCSVIGDYTSQLFEQITCSKLFLGVDGIDLEHGITNSNIAEANLNKKMIEASLRTIILADSSKFGRRGFGKICDLNRVDVIITDSGISKAMAQSIEEIGIELIIV